ncbi:hypothetical protein FRB93_003520 [Tulasnella sp. JGI-2019a]|nr:hypothetical protein FRB93_003520 [Tulasnella sp. JGI-2019a]
MNQIRKAFQARRKSLKFHEAVMVPELLLLYFVGMSGEELLVIAMVCRAWSLVALDLYWSTNYASLSMLAMRLIHTRQPLARGTRRVFEERRPIESFKQHPSTSRDIHPDDWSYFLHLAQKIGRLRISVIPDHVFTNKLQKEIVFGSNPIFPQLKSLYLNVESFFGVKWSPLLSLILTPTIDTLDVIGGIDSMNLVNIVTFQAISVAKRIQNLGVSGPLLPLLLQPPSNELQQLTILRLHRFNPGVLHEIAHLPNLVELYFENYLSSTKHRISLAGDIILPALEILSFDGENTTPHLRVHIFIEIVMPRLHTLILRPYLKWEYADTAGILLLEERSPLLKRFDVGWGSGPGPSIWPLGSLTNTLLRFTQLREIKIETHESDTMLYEGYVAWFVEHLPLLESLVLAPVDPEKLGAFTEKVLVEFTAFPTVLKHLDIPLNLSTIDQVYLSAIPPEHETASTLRSFRARPLILSGKQIGEAARFLAAWCPNVKDWGLRLKFVDVAQPAKAKRFEEAFWTGLRGLPHGSGLT